MKLQNVWMYQPSITLDNELSEYLQRSCAQTYQLVMLSYQSGYTHVPIRKYDNLYTVPRNKSH